MLAEYQINMLRLIRDNSAATGQPPSYTALAERGGIPVADVERELQGFIDDGHMWQTCCGPNPGIHVRLPGEPSNA